MDNQSGFPYRRVILLNSLGIFLSGYLIQLSFIGKAGDFCELLGTDCLSVIFSRYGSVWGVSSASLGLCYFVFHLSFLIGLKKVQPDRPDVISSLVLLLSVIGLAFSLYYVYVLTMILQEKCLACYGVHLVNFLLFIQYLFLCIRGPAKGRLSRLGSFLMEGKTLTVGIISLLLSTNMAFGANLLETRYHLAREREKIRSNLHYFRYLYNQSEKKIFAIGPKDLVVGEKGIAIHQIVLLYKQGCSHCRKAKEKLIDLVKKNEMSVYLIIKDIKDLKEDRLKQLNVSKFPAVFVDGKMAAGWDIPGFMTEFTQDCGC